MNRALISLGLLFLSSFFVPLLFAQNTAEIVFKVAPPDYVLIAGGLPQSYTQRDDGLRIYTLPAGLQRVTLTAEGYMPRDVELTVKDGAARIEAKLEPRGGHLFFLGSATTADQPRHLCFSPDGTHLFVALLSGGVDVFAVPSLKKLGHLTAPQGGVSAYTDVAIVDGNLWAVQDDGRIHVFDPKTLAFLSSHEITGGGSSYLTPLPSSNVMIVNNDSSQVLIVNAKTFDVTGQLSLPGGARDAVVQGNTAWISLFDKKQIAYINLSPLRLEKSWSVGSAPRPVGVLGNVLLVGDMATGIVHFLDLTTGKELRKVDVTANPHEMVQDPRQPWVAVASRGRNNPQDYRLPGPEFGAVTLLDSRGIVQSQVWGRNQPTGLAFSSDGRFFAFTDFLSDDVELYRVRD